MLLHVWVLAICAGLCFAGPHSRDRRQASDDDQLASLCGTGLTGPVYLPHPTDPTKFVQCAPGGRVFVVQCPTGEKYSQANENCVSGQVTTTVATPASQCTAENIANNNIFFAYPDDKTKFVECNGVNQPQLLSCPSRLVWDSNRNSCIYVAGSLVTPAPGFTPFTSLSGFTFPTGGTGGNPCAGKAGNNLFFPGPSPTQYVQCDLAGNAYVMNCPARLIWNQATSRCAGYAPGTVG